MSRRVRSGEVADVLGVAVSTVRAYARAGVIPATATPGGQYRFNLDEVRQALAELERRKRLNAAPWPGAGKAVLADLRTCARAHIEHYTDPNSGRAFQAYDLLGDPDHLRPTDLLAPALLDAPVRGRDVIEMLKPDGAYHRLFIAMEAVLSDEAALAAALEDQDFRASSGPWALVAAALEASSETRNIKASKVTKILHRKRPSLVPIFDRRVAGAYGVSAQTPWLFWPLFRDDVLANRDWLVEVAADYQTPDGRTLSHLRAADIIIWEHSWGCSP